MAIDTSCPHCKTRYRLKDELAGKTVTCREAACRKVFAVVAAPPKANGAAPELDAEALAAQLFAEEAGDKAPPGQERQVAVECYNCNHKWTEPESKAGKFALCPECRTRTKVPELKAKKAADWRDATGGRRLLEKGPELPKDLEDMQMREASFDTLKKAGVIEEPELEPRLLGQKLMFAGLGVLLVGLIAGGGWWAFRTRSDGKENQYAATAVQEIAEIKDDGPLPKGQPPLFRAALHIATGVYSVRQDSEDGVKQALKHFGDARTELEAAPRSLERDALFDELAVALLALGGDNEQVKSKIRIPWSQQGLANNQPINGQTRFVQVELRQVLTATVTKGVDPEVRKVIVRRLARELARRGNPEVLFEMYQNGFDQTELGEATAQMLLECLLAGAPADKVKQQAVGLKEQVKTEAQVPVTAVALFRKLDLTADLKPQQLRQPVQGQAIDFPTALALVQDHTTADPVRITAQFGDAFERLRLLAALAEVSTDPKPALDAAVEVASSKNDRLTLPASVTLWRLVRAALRAGQLPAADTLVKAMKDDGLREWAQAEALAAKWGGSKAAAPAGEAPKPAATNAAHVGHAWGCLLFARHNAATTGGGNPAVEYEPWGKGELRGFGYAGHALGLQDRK